jgi:hypothetical protein
MSEIISQLSNLKIAKFRIFLQAQEEAVLPALIGSTLRGAFGHQWKVIGCQKEAGERGRCLLAKTCLHKKGCLYAEVFEPVSERLKDPPRPFVFEPPIPPLTREISESQTLKLKVSKQGKISFNLILIGQAIRNLPYFIYAFELMAQQGLGAGRFPFLVTEVFHFDLDNTPSLVYSHDSLKINHFEESNLAELVQVRLSQLEDDEVLRIRFLTPLRINRQRHLLEELDFSELIKECSLRVKFLAENYGTALDYDYQALMKKAETIQTYFEDRWRHRSQRWTNRREKKEPLDGMLGEIHFGGKSFIEFYPLVVAGEILHIGNSTSFGLGKFRLE